MIQEGELVFLQTVNYEIAFADIQLLLELVCDCPHPMEEEARTTRARGKVLRWTKMGAMEYAVWTTLVYGDTGVRVRTCSRLPCRTMVAGWGER